MKIKLMCLWALLTVQVSAQTVSEHKGDILITDSQGHTEQITSSGRDYDPQLSIDQKFVVFARKAEGSFESDIAPVGNTVSQLWMADRREGGKSRLLLGDAISIKGRKFHEFSSPHMSPDNKAIYFLIAYKASTPAIVRFEIATGSVDFIAEALNFELVPSGEYGGYLIVQQRRPLAGAGYYEWYWLLDPQGADQGLIGLEYKSVKTFLELWAGR